MAFRALWILALRDVGRNRRRSGLSVLAVAMGLALLIVLNSFIAGIVGDSLQNAIRLDTGHVQLRAASYEQHKLSLRGSDLVGDLDPLVARAQSRPEVAAAAPVLWLGGILTHRDEAVNLRLVGLDPRSPVHAPLRQALVAGAWLAADDRNGVLLGRRLADSLGVAVGLRVNLTIVNSDGRPDEGAFAVRGLFATGIPTYDDSAVLLPLAKAQAFAAVRGRASAVVILLRDENDAAEVAAALQGGNTAALTWRDMMATLIQGLDTAMRFYLILDGIVMLVVAVVIANTLLMAVFERVREMGILAALGMKSRQVIQMILLEGTILGVVGIAAGILLGLLLVAYLAAVGLDLGESVAASAGKIALPTVLHARFVPGTTLALAVWTLAVVLLAALYPARFAARLEPVEALRPA